MIRLMINADDFGANAKCNMAIHRCFEGNLIDRATVMVNMPSYNEAITLSNQGRYSDKIGLHINLIEGLPLTDSIKNTVFCTEGVFNGRALRVQKNRFYLDKKTSDAVKTEIEAQMKLYIESGFTLMHVDSHEHTHTNWSILKILLECSDKYNFRTIRLSRNIPRNEIKFDKLIYKDVINFFIKRRNSKYSNWNCQFFGSQDDVTTFIRTNVTDNLLTELMIHPTMDGVDLKDAFNKENIEKWLDANKEYILRDE